MGESDHEHESIKVEDRGEELKYLAFVQLATVQAAMMLSCLYSFAKENSGPLKHGVQSVEGTVKTVVRPVYEKFQDVPLDLLKYVDHKVDGLVHEVERHVPPAVKGASGHAFSVAQRAPAMAKSVASEVHRSGVVETATEIAKTAYEKVQPTAFDLYEKYEPVAEKYAVSAWKSLNRLPLFPEVAHVVVPTAAYCSEKYNDTVRSVAQQGYSFSSCLPLIPVDRIAKVFGEEARS